MNLNNNMKEDLYYLFILEYFFENHDHINTGNLQEFLVNMNEIDKKAIFGLPTFFEKIRSFILKENVLNNQKNNIERYIIKFRNNYYQIGMYNTFDFIYYCNKIEQVDNYIDMNDYLFSNNILLIENKSRVKTKGGITHV